ncbi:DUF4232 domain-containing protein [Streptomyces sp. NBC_00344]|uniref:DUF4232 domain-containing protein n=1 Tax=Streptomyces sp. NBC_00344 TaxID=2975720 RepID=UPI002E1C0583
MHAQPNRLSRRLAAVIAVTALGLGAGACSSSSDTKGSAASDSSTASDASTGGKDTTTAGSGGSGTASSNGSSTGGSSAGGSSKGSASRGSSGKGSTNGASGAARCHTADLKAAFATGGDAVPDMKSENQTRASVAFTNIGSHSCTLSGFPGVDVVGNQSDDGTWSLSRSSKPVTAISLAPGDSTDFSITLGATTQKGSGTFEPGLVRITPPDEKKQFELRWPFGGAVTQQDGATHPATFVNPIGS